MNELTEHPPLRRFRWWYKGLTPEGVTASFSGIGVASDPKSASDNIEEMMRKSHPTIRWMQGKEVERPGLVLLGPTIQMGAVVKFKPL